MKNIKSFFVVVTLIALLLPSVAGAVSTQHQLLSRPNSENGPTEVSVGVWLLDIDSIDSSAQSFIANIYIGLQWNDPKLIHEGPGYVTYDLNDIWSPRIQIANEIGLVRKTLPSIVRVDPDGTATYRQRYIGPFSQPLKLENFPFDEQLFRLHFITAGLTPEQVTFVRNKKWVEGGLDKAAGISGDISLPDWKIVSFDTKATHYVLSPSIQTAGYAFDFIAARDVTHYIWKVFLPLLLIVMMSWSVFWIDPSNAGIQIGVSTTSMLTLIAYRFAIDSQVPRVPYMTKLDQFVVVGTILIFLSLTQVVLTSWLAYTNRSQLARRIDRVSRFIFPIVFVIALTISLIA